VIQVSNLNQRSLKGKMHFAAATIANGLIRRAGVRPLLNPALAFIGACFGSRARIRLSLDGQVALEIPLSDAYWVAAGFDGAYEPEVLAFLDRLEDHTTLFVDCGANIGWWALLAEKRWCWTSVAIEASSSLVRRIEDARAANDANVVVLHKAVWKSDGETLKFRTSDSAHAGGHLCGVRGFVQDWRVAAFEGVESMTIDSIVMESAARKKFDRIIVKIDVEGAEPEAIEGAHRTIESGALLIYEDHGSDRSCSTTASLLEMGLDVYSLEGGIERVHTLDQALALKTSHRKGYNFVAAARNSAAATQIADLSAPRSKR
jgi:FkbM family methyltransferase